MKTKKGFTLIELVVVMAIIAVLALMIVAAITAARRQSVEGQNRNNARTVEVAMESYASRNNGKYPLILGGETIASQIDPTLATPTDLNVFTPSWSVGTCDNGGGKVDSDGINYKIIVHDHSCNASTNIAEFGELELAAVSP